MTRMSHRFKHLALIVGLCTSAAFAKTEADQATEALEVFWKNYEAYESQQRKILGASQQSNLEKQKENEASAACLT